MSILGNRVARREDPLLLTAGGTYVDDVRLDGAATVTFVRSTVAHARLGGVDVTSARAVPGVLAVFTARDVDLPPPEARAMMGKAIPRPWLAGEVVRFVGEPIALVVSETSAQGADAAELVEVDYDPLRAVVEPEAALEHTVLLHPDEGSNVVVEMGEPPAEDFFAGCEVVVRQRIVNQRLAPCPLETRAGAALWSGDGRLTQYASTQAPHGFRDSLALIHGLAQDQVRVVAPDVGGGFGAKVAVSPEEGLLGWVARRVGRPVRWAETRSESMVALGHGRGQVQQAAIGGSRDGRIDAYSLRILQDSGAYTAVGAVLPFLTRMMAPGVYAIPRVTSQATSVLTNTTPTGAYRGAGRPEASAAIERMVDLFAAETGIDPADVRRRNALPADAFPHTTAAGATYDSGDYPGALDRVLHAAGYTELRAEQARRRAAAEVVQLGIGLSLYVEVTNGLNTPEYGSVEVTANGGAVVRSGISPHGQGHATMLAMLVHDATGIAMDDISVELGDTDAVPRGEGTLGSRSLQTGGVAVRQAAEAVVEQARLLAAEYLDADSAAVALDVPTGRFLVSTDPSRSRAWADLGAAATQSGEPLRAEIDFVPASPTFPFGAHCVVVEVDTQTGKVTVLRVVAVDDAGRILNPLLAEGQVHGGLAQGIAQGLLEEVRYDSDGNPLTGTLADYGMISAAELPSFELVSMETPTPLNPLGAKGIGESGTIGSTPAVQNAVVDALAHLGVRHIDMPCTPERVWRAIAAAARMRG